MRAASPRTLLAGVGLLAAIAVGASTLGSSGAAYVDATAARPASVGAATMRVTSSAEGGALVDASALRPGSVRTGVVTVQTNGTRGADVRFVVDQADGPLAHVVTVSLARCATLTGSCDAPAGVLAPVALADAGSTALGAFDATETRRYLVTLAWPASATDPDLQGASVQPHLAFVGRSGS